ncbi:MAG: amidohydrolase family protein [Vicinamibacteraceae bacterium]
MRKVTAALHRAGVPLVAGTDAMGLPLIVPGASLHRELRILIECGLTPYEAIRTATINPAVFLGQDREFGTVAEGKRADLLLVEGNPLQDLTHLRRPMGVMVRGTWIPRNELQQRLAALRSTAEPRADPELGRIPR